MSRANFSKIKHNATLIPDLSTSVIENNIENVDHLIRENRQIFIRQISDALSIGIGSVETIVNSLLKFHKVSDRWVSKQLSNEQKAKQVKI